MKLAKLAIVAAALALTTANTPPHGNWNTTVAATPRAHVVGNPQAKTTLAEFVSYTCPHCGMFAIQGDPALKLAYIGPGHIKLEVRPVIRNVVDLVITTLAQCGPQEKFLQNHAMFMTRQSSWLTKAERATPAQTQLWSQGNAAGFRAMASALDFYGMMAQRGYERTQIDACLADSKKMQQIVANTRADAKEFGVRATPSFTINGKLLEDVHSWQQLEPALKKHFGGQTPQ